MFRAMTIICFNCFC